MRRNYFVFILAAMAWYAPTAMATEPIDIGSRLELFVDDYLIEKMSGGAELQLHRPVERELAMVCDKPWEGNRSGLPTAFRDGEVYRMYYRGSQITLSPGSYGVPYSVTCYAESNDGIHWIRPELGLIEFKGSKKNNIVWIGEESNTFAPFKDTNPNCPPEQRYKAFALLSKNRKRYPVSTICSCSQ